MDEIWNQCYMYLYQTLGGIRECVGVRFNILQISSLEISICIVLYHDCLNWNENKQWSIQLDRNFSVLLLWGKHTLIYTN